MSVIQHPSFFDKDVPHMGKSELFRNIGAFEKLLFIAREEVLEQARTTLEMNFFDVHTASDEEAAIEEILDNNFDVVICDTGLENFPFETFYFVVEKTKPGLLDTFIFLVDSDTAPEVTQFVERIDGLKVWRPLELSELFQMIEIVLGRSAVLATI